MTTSDNKPTCGECRHYARVTLPSDDEENACFWEPAQPIAVPHSISQQYIILNDMYADCPCFEPKPTEADNAEAT